VLLFFLVLRPTLVGTRRLYTILKKKSS
jgi:hypothetical protein